MPRTPGTTNNSYTWRIGTWDDGSPVDVRYFKRLNDACSHYEMTYNQLAELGPNGRTKFKFRYVNHYLFKVEKVDILAPRHKILKNGDCMIENYSTGTYELVKCIC